MASMEPTTVTTPLPRAASNASPILLAFTPRGVAAPRVARHGVGTPGVGTPAVGPHGGAPDLAATTAEWSILFADIRGYSGIAEQLHPRVLHGYVDRFLVAMTDVIVGFRGTVDKYIGDAVMAYWGGVSADNAHAERAVRCALALVDAARRVDQALDAEGLPRLQISVGINSGSAHVGHLGPLPCRTPTILGDAVNLAARFQSLAGALGVAVLIGERTVALAPAYEHRCLGLMKIRGRLASARVFEPLALRRGLSVKSASQNVRSYPEIAPDEFRSALSHLDVPDLRLDL